MYSTHESHRDPTVRASDADREQVAEILRNGHAEGRLDTEEMQQRIDACYAAKTVGELEALLHDLPGAHQHERSRPEYGRRFPMWFGLGRGRRLPLLPIAIALVVLSIVTGHGFFWIAIPLFFLATRFFGFGCGRRRRMSSGGQWA